MRTEKGHLPSACQNLCRNQKHNTYFKDESSSIRNCIVLSPSGICVSSLQINRGEGQLEIPKYFIFRKESLIFPKRFFIFGAFNSECSTTKKVGRNVLLAQI